ncbi:hypothetical protein D3C75_1006460 [compost metagenome]
MLTARQRGQHGQGIIAINGFTQDLPIEHHGGVGAQHRQGGLRINGHECGQASIGLGPCQAFDVSLCGLTGQRAFVDRSTEAGEGNADLSQQFPSAG